MQGDEGVRIPLIEANRELPGGQAVLERFKDLFLTRQSAAPHDLGGLSPSRAATVASVTDAQPAAVAVAPASSALEFALGVDDGAESVTEPSVTPSASADPDDAEVAVAPADTASATDADTDTADAGAFDDEPAPETPVVASTAEDEALLAAAGTFDLDDDDAYGDRESTAMMAAVDPAMFDAPAATSEAEEEDDDPGAGSGATTIMPAFDPALLESDDEPEPEMESTRMMAAVDPAVFETPAASAAPTSADDDPNRRGGRRNKRGRRGKK